MTNDQARALANLLNQLPDADGIFHPLHISGDIWGISAEGFIWEDRLRADVDGGTTLQSLPDKVVDIAKGIISDKAKKMEVTHSTKRDRPL